ncbi:MAG TPA: hypothetical protein VIK58_14600 [Caldimonas sp.]
MRLVDGIRTVGFRKWYQGELTRSHLSLVMLLLCGIGALVTLELVGLQGPMSDRIGSFVLLLACASIGAVALRRYLFLLMRAELAAREAVCPKCATYGKLDLAADEPQQERMEVRCQRCRNVWSMSDAGDE